MARFNDGGGVGKDMGWKEEDNSSGLFLIMIAVIVAIVVIVLIA